MTSGSSFTFAHTAHSGGFETEKLSFTIVNERILVDRYINSQEFLNFDHFNPRLNLIQLDEAYKGTILKSPSSRKESFLGIQLRTINRQEIISKMCFPKL